MGNNASALPISSYRHAAQASSEGGADIVKDRAGREQAKAQEGEESGVGRREGQAAVRHALCPGRRRPFPERSQDVQQECVCCMQSEVWPNSAHHHVAVLRIRAGDQDALQAKLYLLLQTEQYAEALTLVDSLSNGSEHDFEKAYSFYKTNEKGKASDLLAAIGNEEHRGALHLQAQLVSAIRPSDCTSDTLLTTCSVLPAQGI